MADTEWSPPADPWGPIAVPEEFASTQDVERWAASYPPERQADVRIALVHYLDEKRAAVEELELRQAQRRADLAALLGLREDLRAELIALGEDVPEDDGPPRTV
ncbi:hypothetical protein AB0C74_38775 [Spirillospora sp. NPDC048832]